MASYYEHAVKRAFQYLNLSQQEVGSEAAREVLRIVEDELARGEQALVSRVLDRLEQRFNPPVDMPCAAAPPLCRGSIGHT